MPAKRKAAKTEQQIQLSRLQEQEYKIRIVGQTPVIPHRWSEKAKRMMPGHPEREIETKKGVRKPKEEADACLYKLPDGRLGLPATSIKAAMVSACRFFEKPSMTEAKLLFFVVGEHSDDGQLVAVKGKTRMREDTPRNANGSADLRYRYEIWPWSAEVRVKFVSSSISAESIVAILDAAGRVGVGDWRPGAPKSHTGTYGTWKVETK